MTFVTVLLALQLSSTGQPDAARTQRLAAAAAHEASLASQPRPPTAYARSVLNGVLAQRGFQQSRGESWRAALQRRLRDWFTSLWERTLGRRIGQRRAAETLAWSAAAAAIAVLIVWLLRLGSRRRGERLVSMGTIPVPRLPGHILGMRAAALIREGNIREGVRVAYQAGVSRLAEEGALRVDDARTPRESLRLLSPEHRRRPAFAALTAIFERAWYGSRAPDAGAGETVLQLLEDLHCLSFDRAKQL